MKLGRQPFDFIDSTRGKLDIHLECHPLTKARWRDFELLFGKNGACGGCWCMLWRLPRKQFDAQKGEGNRKAMKAIVDSGTMPGLLGYFDGQPVGWCAVAPRDHYPALNRSRILKPVDDQPCWSVSCLFVHRAYRKKGVSTQLLRAAIGYVRTLGGRILEAYPVEPKGDKMIPAAFAWTGIPKAFESVGFSEVARRSPTRPIMRYNCGTLKPTADESLKGRKKVGRVAS
jgi:GNAT superfamily N-acetyltransferase